MKLRGGIDKKGLSPVVATALLILLVIVMVAIIFLWARGFVNEQIEKFGRPIENLCEELNYEVLYSGTGTSAREFEFINRGDIAIRSFQVKKVSGGNSEGTVISDSLDPGASIKQSISVTVDGNEADEVIFYPTLVGSIKEKDSNTVFTCLNQGKTITL